MLSYEICEIFNNTYFEEYLGKTVSGGVGGGGSSICRWTGNEDFQYGISRFWEKYGRETGFSALDGAGNYWKKQREIGI